ncbi:MAG: hypothetical protein WKF89_11240 [Chitinophagaceae bacterium]
MKTKILCAVLIYVNLSVFNLSCHKNQPQKEEDACSAYRSSNSTPCFNLNVNLKGKGTQSGFSKFRQDPDSARIITLDTRINHLVPRHEYLLQRAVDPINAVDGNCTSTTWLTLGRGLTAQSILTDGNGNGTETLWRDISAIATGSTFDIHFQIIDATSMAVVLSSDCYQYTVR